MKYLHNYDQIVMLILPIVVYMQYTHKKLISTHSKYSFRAITEHSSYKYKTLPELFKRYRNQRRRN